ncbi:MAG: alpha/beta hydrolase [Flavobacteriaceae bacterium]
MKKFRLYHAFFLAFYISGCAQEKSSGATLTEILNISYQINSEPDSLQQLNLLIPKDIDSPPLLLWIGGGAWSFVDRHMEMDLCKKIATAGIAVASVGHRLSKGSFSEKRKPTGVQHPEHIKDVATAFTWLVKHAEEYGYDNKKIFVGGFSSGAHLSALLGMDARYLQAHGLSPDNIKGLLPISGAYDIPDYYNVFFTHENASSRAFAQTHVKDVFGEEENFVAASPVTYIDELKLPMLLVSDNALDNYTKLFEKKLKEIGYDDFEVYYEKALNHGELWRAMSTAENNEVRSRMIKFIRKHS